VEAERRQVTVLFTDMVGFTAFAEKSGEEAAFTLMRSLAQLMDGAVHEQGGIVQSFTGDGIMAAFGTATAFEDAPLRACRAALSILQRLQAAEPEFELKHGTRPQLRIGLNSGTAIVGQVQAGADAAITVLGDAVNLAKRLESLAQPNSVYMSETMYRLVQGMVEASLVGGHSIKGKSEAQTAYRLYAMRPGVTRFEAAMGRGLSGFVGRERELEVLEQALTEAHSKLRVIALIAEPGMGKSRLLHEFRQRIGGEQTSILTGHCSPDGQETAFLPFLEVVRHAFRIAAGDTEQEIAQKLEMGLTALDLRSMLNIALLLHLLGLKSPNGALAGLDGALIGLRTRELLLRLLEARCRVSAVILVIEDLHWIDSISEELLGQIIRDVAQLPVLVIHSARPEYRPPWRNSQSVTALHLEPLPAGEIRRLVQARLGAKVLPDALVRQVAERAEGNPLFAEEILSFLTERGVLRFTSGKVEFDLAAVAAALPASVQSLLTARVDRLAPKERRLLQAAAVIGRRFDKSLLASLVNYGDDLDPYLAVMQALDLIHSERDSSDYSFKHALVRDALYESLLTDARTELHSLIADEIELRSNNRLIEVAEALAHHYSQTKRADKAFTYLSMAGSKNLNVYSLTEAESHFSAAIALAEAHPECASDQQIAKVLVEYTLLLNALGKVTDVVDIADKFAIRLHNLGANIQTVLVLHQKVFGLCFMTRFKTAQAEQEKISAMAERLGDNRSRAYCFASQILISSAVGPEVSAARSAIEAASATEDAYIRSVVRWVIAIDEISRGRMDVARQIAEEMSAIGHQLNDPRPKGMGMGILGWLALTSDDYEKALFYADECLQIAYTPQERLNALGVKGSALALLKRTDEARLVLSDTRRRLTELNWRYELILLDPAFGVLTVLSGEIAKGIRTVEKAMATAHRDGWRVAEDWAKLFLCEIYLEVMFSKNRPKLKVLWSNAFVIIKILLTGSFAIQALISEVRDSPRFDTNGHHIGRAQMILGLLYKAKKKRVLAIEHLSDAKRILSQFGRTPILARVETALAELYG
jgi:class 3 adenylate cyclase/tetratricopeptide (TPR) repeat protein